MTDKLMRAAQIDTCQEITSAIVAAVNEASVKHGDDPEFKTIVIAAFGSALESLDMLGAPETLAFSQALRHHYQQLNGPKG